MTTPKDPNFIGRCRNLKAHGFRYSDIARYTNRPISEVYTACTGRKMPPKSKKTTADYVAELIADVPEGRDPAEHRRCVLAVFGGGV